MSAAGRDSLVSSLDPDLLRLQEAATMKSGDGVAVGASWPSREPSHGQVGGETAHSIVASRPLKGVRSARLGAAFLPASVLGIVAIVAGLIVLQRAAPPQADAA